MYQLNGKQFEELAEVQGGVCASIYLPTHRMGAETLQDRKELRKTLDEAEDRLVSYGVRRPIAQQVLEPAARLIDDSGFWQHQSQGLAIFMTPGRHWLYRLSRTVERLVTVGDRLHLTPLLPQLTEDGRFYVLCLSSNLVRLLDCTSYGVEEVDVPDMPRSFEEIGRYIDDAERQVQMHTTTTTAGEGRRGQSFHGHGQGSDDRQVKKWLNDFCHTVEKSVSRHLEGETAPLVLAAAEPIEAIYRQCNTYPHLFKDRLEGNTDHMGIEEIQSKAWPVIRPYFADALGRIRKTYGDAAGQHTASYDPHDILFAAQDGRVGMLLVASDDHLWGHYDPTTGEIHIADHPTPPDEDLLNTAAIFTHRTGGQVFAMPEEQMPNHAPLAAVFRY